MTVLEFIRERHTKGESADALLLELVDALVICTISWAGSAVDIASAYLDEVKRRRG